MGYLAYGAAAGVGKEYLKQSEETRERDYQTIRDKRLSDLKKGERTHAGEILTTENIRQEDVAADVLEGTQGYEAEQSGLDRKATASESDLDRKATASESKLEREAKGPPTASTAAGAESGHYEKQEDGTFKYVKDVDQPNRPTRGSVAANLTYQKWMDETVRMRHSLKRETMGSLRDDWQEDAYDTLDNPDYPGLGLKITRRNPNVPDFPIWLNKQIIEEDHLKVDDPKYMVGNPDALWDYAMRTYPQMKTSEGQQKALERIKGQNPWWQGPQGQQGGVPGVEAVNPGSEGPNAGGQQMPSEVPPPQPNNLAGVAPAAGMLTQSQAPAPAPTVQEGAGGATISVNSRGIAEAEAELAALEGKKGRNIPRLRETLRRKIEYLKTAASR